jgi:hypothetical protein
MSPPSFLPALGLRAPNYDRTPAVAVPSGHARACWSGWEAILATLRTALAAQPSSILAVECYPGVHDDDLRVRLAAAFAPAFTLDAKGCFQSPAEIDALVAPDLGGDDPIFGRMSTLRLEQFLDPVKLATARARIAAAKGLVLVVGPAAALVAPESALLVFADLPRWEGQLRQRRGEVDNLGVRNRGLKASLQYKRAFFIDWRVADRLKRATMARWNFLLDTTSPATPKLMTGAAHLAGLAAAAARPFRVVPFFDPGPWGGQWMREICALPDGPPNYAWCFDCVPEENSLLLEFAGGERIEIPAINLVFHQPVALLGEAVHGRFGAEFPIRFDFLDTIQGGNLSFQVHPTTEYAREHFGLGYTQDESYYILDATPGAEVYLGCKNGTDPAAMFADLTAAQRGEKAFDDARFAARFPARKHDHFLIPAGTLHCAGAGAMVLEISATPYIFTFKLWDWNRLDLDGLPRPVNLARGRSVIDWSRDENYALARLVNQVTEVARGEGWVEERTGLHDAEFIETRRHWFTAPVAHETRGGVNVLNLVAGAEVVVESPTGAFAPYLVHYAETFIVPAAVGAYTIRPATAGARCATVKAFVRTRA